MKEHSTNKVVVPKKEKSHLNLIHSLDPTTDLQKTQKRRARVKNYHQRSSPFCGIYYRKNDAVSSTNTLQEKRAEQELTN